MLTHNRDIFIRQLSKKNRFAEDNKTKIGKGEIFCGYSEILVKLVNSDRNKIVLFY